MGGTEQKYGRRRGRSVASAGLAIAVGIGLAGAVCEAEAGQGYALMGGGGGLGGVLSGHDDGLHGYGGVIYAPAHSLSDSGLLLRAWAKAFEFTYDTDLPEASDIRIGALGYGVQVEAGWQIARPWGRIAFLPGLAWRDYKLTPSDPGSRLSKGRIAVSVTGDGEWRFSDRFGIMANASYLTGFEDYWAQARPFVHIGGGWKVGLDFAGWGGPDYAKIRAGAFTSGYELPVKALNRRLFLGAEAGVQADMDGSHLAPFAGLNVGLLF